MDISTIFGPTFWAVPGRSIPMFNVTGNHGFTAGAVPGPELAGRQRGKQLRRQDCDPDNPTGIDQVLMVE